MSYKTQSRIWKSHNRQKFNREKASLVWLEIQNMKSSVIIHLFVKAGWADWCCFFLQNIRLNVRNSNGGIKTDRQKKWA